VEALKVSKKGVLVIIDPPNSLNKLERSSVKASMKHTTEVKFIKKQN
jgi:hypothetical protein